MRLNTVVMCLVGAAVAGLLMAAVSRDASRQSPLANATRPQLTPATVVITTSTSTTVGGDLMAAGMVTPADLFGVSSTTTSSIAVAATVSVPARGAAPVTNATATTTARAPGTTVVNPDVVFSEVPTTISPVTTTPVATTAPPPPTTTTPTTAAPTTTTPTTATTATTAVTLPLGLPPLLNP